MIVKILLGILGVIILLLAVAVIHTLLIPKKKSDYVPKADDKAELYADKLSKMIQYETVSTPDDPQGLKFYGFHELLEKLFPQLHKALKKTVIDGNLLYFWEGKKHDKTQL